MGAEKFDGRNPPESSSLLPLERMKNVDATLMPTRWNKDKGCGSLLLDNGRTVFVHFSELCGHLKPGRGNVPNEKKKVRIGEIGPGQKGPQIQALNVECLDCITPPQWELVPTGRAIGDIQEWTAKCVNKEYAPRGTCPISDKQVCEKNRPYKEALTKHTAREKIWNNWISNKKDGDQFFAEFGEPASIKVEKRINEPTIILTYLNEFGDRRMTATEAYWSGHWETTPSGRTGEIKESEPIKAGFLLKELPEVEAFIPVADCGDVTSRFYMSHPTLRDAFKLLPAEQQASIISRLQSTIKTPEQIAKLRMEIAEKNCEVQAILKEIITLQSPGQTYLFCKSLQEIIGGGLTRKWSEDDMQYYDTYSSPELKIVKHWFLVVGARETEHDRFSQLGSPKTIYVDRPMNSGVKIYKVTWDDDYDERAPEWLRLSMLAGYRGKLKSIVDPEENKPISIPDDPRLYTMTPEEWKKRYNQEWEKLKTEREAQWKEAEDNGVATLKQEWEEYDRASEEIRQLREKMWNALQRAKEYWIDIPRELHLYDVIIGWHDIDKLRQSIVSYRGYVETVESTIADELARRKEVEIKKLHDEEALREAMEVPGKPVQWYLYKTAPEAFVKRYGRSYGEGFGAKVAGKTLYLGGDRPIVGITFPGVPSRNQTTINTSGLAPLEYGFPTCAGSRREGESQLRGIVEVPDWNVTSVDYRDGQATAHHLWNKSGVGHWYQSNYQSFDWEGNEGKGPTVQEVADAHKIRLSWATAISLDPRLSFKQSTVSRDAALPAPTKVKTPVASASQASVQAFLQNFGNQNKKGKNK